jgi:hypothetical protein
MAIKRNQVSAVRTESPAKKSSGIKTVTAHPTIAASVDCYNVLSAQIKALEGDQKGHKAAVEAFYRPVFAADAVKGNAENFNIATENSKVQFQTQNRSKVILEKDFQDFANTFGEDVANDLIEVNVGQFKLNPKLADQPDVFEKVYNAIKDLEKTLGISILEEAGMKVCEDVVIKAAKHAGTPEKLQAMLEKLAITQFIKTA